MTHNMLIDYKGKVWVFGSNESGQLGLGDTEDKNIPTKIKNMPLIQQTSCQPYGSILLDYKGGVWVCGNNNEGQLGLKNFTCLKIPTQIQNIPVITNISCRYGFFLVDLEGCIWTGDTSFSETGGRLIKIQHSTPISHIVSTYDYIILLDIDGCVWKMKVKPPKIGHVIDFKLANKILNIPTITDLSAYYGYFMLLDINGDVWSFGDNHIGQLGLGDDKYIPTATKIPKLPKIYKICCGNCLSLFLDIDGVVWACGNNILTASGVSIRSKVPVKIWEKNIISDINFDGIYPLLIDLDGNVWSCGSEINPDFSAHIKIANLPPIRGQKTLRKHFYYTKNARNYKVTKNILTE